MLPFTSPGKAKRGVMMKKSTNLKVLMAMATFGAVSSYADIKLTDNLSTSGFIDMSLNGAKDSVKGNDATLNASLDQFEVDFMYKYGNVSARADINALPSSMLPGAPISDTSL